MTFTEKIVASIERWAIINRRSWFVRIVSYFNWGGLLDILSVAGMHIIPLVLIDKGMVNTEVGFGKMLLQYFHILATVFSDWALGVHLLICIVFLLIFKGLSVIADSVAKNESG
jgi:hypothetical protein